MTGNVTTLNPTNTNVSHLVGHVRITLYNISNNAIRTSPPEDTVDFIGLSRNNRQ